VAKAFIKFMAAPENAGLVRKSAMETRRADGALVPGAAQHFFSGALQTRDRSTLRVWNDPGSAVHHFVLRRVRESP